MESLYARLRDSNGLVFHNPGFIDFIEMHMADLRNSSVSSGLTLEVKQGDKVRANRNFNLLCNIAGIPYHKHWITMRINGMASPSEFSPDMDIIYAVDDIVLSTLILKFEESQMIV